MQLEGEGALPLRQGLIVQRIPIPLLPKAFELGVDVGLSPVVTATGDETPEEVGHKLMAGDQQLWSIADGADFVGTAVTQIERRADGRVLVVKYLAGKTLRDWLGVLHKTFDAFCRETGCVAIEAHSREALRKTFIEHGWRKVAVLFRFDANG